ncbi:hypothetical protein [Thermodesulfovibrio thiophilus]|uniref:hypothetical protein n=1 Tax=Thermodesulfovibrio thiophilus TaxID=340095 RepID=UPI0003FB5597|nr:hypothetical protein [Thermodesulfovibrio thiophilus]
MISIELKNPAQIPSKTEIREAKMALNVKDEIKLQLKLNEIKDGRILNEEITLTDTCQK